MNQNAKQLYRNSNPLAPAVLRGIEMGFTLLAALLMLIFLFVSLGESSGGIVSLSGVTSYLLLLFLPLFVLGGMGIVWMCAFIGSARPMNDGRILSSASVSSLTSSAIGSFTCFPTAIVSIYGAVECGKRVSYLESKASYYSYKSSYKYYDLGSNSELDYLRALHVILIFWIIVLIVGMISLIITSIARKNFYTSVEKTFRGEASVCRSSGLYFAMKIVNSVVRLVILILIIVLLAISGKYTGNTSYAGGKGAMVITAMVFLLIALAVGIIGNILEGVLVKRYSNALMNPYGASAQPMQYYYGTRQPEESFLEQDYTPQDAANTHGTSAVVCPQCGTPDYGSSRFCSRCGTQIR